MVTRARAGSELRRLAFHEPMCWLVPQFLLSYDSVLPSEPRAGEWSGEKGGGGVGRGGERGHEASGACTLAAGTQSAHTQQGAGAGAALAWWMREESGPGDQVPLSSSTSLAWRPRESQRSTEPAALQDSRLWGSERPERARGWERGRKNLLGRAAFPRVGELGPLHPGICDSTPP